jgi:hypothetical protein
MKLKNDHEASISHAPANNAPLLKLGLKVKNEENKIQTIL